MLMLIISFAYVASGNAQRIDNVQRKTQGRLRRLFPGLIKKFNNRN
jgi:hypothetical protein